MTLTAERFTAFYRAVHAREPFHWQQDLVTTVLADGRWPGRIDVPTGLGKTSMLDVAVFIAAASAGEQGRERLGRRRCFFVVDRRLVVDEAAGHANTISAALTAAVRGERDDDVLLEVAAGLRSLCPAAMEDGDLLRVTRMRGGTTWDAAWLDRPDRCGIVVGTVDQVGSRLFFRGYGTSDRRKPLDAALAGTDALLLIDEAHLAHALIQTVRDAQERDQLGLPLPGLDVVELSATHGSNGDNRLQAVARGQYSIDLEAHRDDPEAMRRLDAEKSLSLMTASSKSLSGAMAETALRLATIDVSPTGYSPAVLVVCNTVDRAREVHTRISKGLHGPDASSSVDLDLLIGRTRQIDRGRLIHAVTSRFQHREPSGRPAILVATQTVEVGVNLDVDALVTECASWDALVQRLGRLNRFGRYPERFPDGTARAVVVYDGQENGPVYGTARDATWEQLRRRVGPVDDVEDLFGVHPPGLAVSPRQCRELSGRLPAGEVRLAPRTVPVLQLPTLDAWTRTGPIPQNDPPVDVYLHGFDSGSAPVTLIWRDGLAALDPADLATDSGRSLKSANALLTAMPPRGGEQVEVPFLAVKKWLAGVTTPLLADIDSLPETERREQALRDPIAVLAWRHEGDGPRRTATKSGQSSTGSEGSWVWIDSDELRPGDQLVVPSEYGGLDGYGWNPVSTEPASDVFEAACFSAGRGMLRLDPELGSRLGLSPEQDLELRDAIATLNSGDAASSTPDDLVNDQDLLPPRENLIQTLTESLRHQLRNQLSSAADGSKTVFSSTASNSSRLQTYLDMSEVLDFLETGPVLVEIPPSGDYSAQGNRESLRWLLVAPRKRRAPDTAEVRARGIERDDDDVTASSVSSQRVTLSQHGDAVAQRARQIGDALGFPSELVQAVADAAGWHDVGKSEERFQAMLFGGDPLEAAISPDLLAKSGIEPQDRNAWRRARERSGLPAGARHEAWSAALVREYLHCLPRGYAGDVDLVIHLVASHHGHARPLLPLVVDPDPRPVAFEISGVKITVASDETVDLDNPARFARLNDRYGRWGLALLESVVRCADMTVSSEGS